MSLSEIYDSLCAQDSLQTEYCDNFIVVKDLSSKNLGYCIIYPKQSDQFNYIADNMACKFQNGNSKPNPDFYELEILVPMHFIPELREDNRLIENKEYEFNSTKKKLISFYEESGFEVESSQDGIIVKDPLGHIYDGKSYFDATINHFEIILHGSTVSYRQIIDD